MEDLKLKLLNKINYFILKYIQSNKIYTQAYKQQIALESASETFVGNYNYIFNNNIIILHAEKIEHILKY